MFAQIKARVEEGRWEVMGGTWVEPDCNAIGAELLARQFLLGRGYFRKHFGDVDTPVLWLPDTFGYSWALPQLIKQAGMKYFITHKMSWNQYNQMPNQILWWQGLDGTRVLTHFLTTPAGMNFCPTRRPTTALCPRKKFSGRGITSTRRKPYNELITAYGLRRWWRRPNTRDAREFAAAGASSRRAARAPRHGARVHGTTSKEVADSLPVWNGEFYLEYHRGTYTSQARNKRNNRKSEFLMHDAEFLARMGSTA